MKKRKIELERRMKELENISEKYESEKDKMKDKFTQSLQILKEMKEH